MEINLKNRKLRKFENIYQKIKVPRNVEILNL